MTLQFFRKHKKWFFVLMGLAVFAIVVWQIVMEIPAAVERLRFGRRRPNDPDVFIVYGRPISRYDAQMVLHNLEAAVRYGELVSAYSKAVRGKPGGDKKVEVLRQHSSIMPPRYYMANSDEERQKVFRGTLVLLEEARQAGLTATPEMAQEYLKRLHTAGIEPAFLDQLFRLAFKNSPELMVSALQQEMVLSLYLEPMAGGAKVLREDVDETFRMDQERVEIHQAILWSTDFLKEVAQPSEEAIRAQFERYKSKLPGESPNGFGYKIPDRIKFQYLVARMEDAKKLVTVSEEEIKDYYCLLYTSPSPRDS